MYRFFSQLLLSMVIGVGAVVGFRSDVRGNFNKTLPDAKAVVNERANVSLKSIEDMKTQVSMSVSLSTKGKTALSAKATAKANAKLKGGLNMQANSNTQVSTQVNTGGAGSSDLIPNVSLDSSLNTNSQTNLGAGLEDLDVDLKNTIKSGLDLQLNLK